jgi:basic amino acid/polyamine antiporter, APA family
VIADRLLGARAGNIMGLVSIVSLAATISAMTFAGPRVYYAMARDGLFFPAAARVHSRYRTPAVAIVAQAIWSGLLVLSGGASALTRYTGFAVVLFSGVAVAALFVLRFREPSAPRPFRAVGYPVAPAIFILASLAIVLNAVYSDPGPAGAGLVLAPPAAFVEVHSRAGFASDWQSFDFGLLGARRLRGAPAGPDPPRTPNLLLTKRTS